MLNRAIPTGLIASISSSNRGSGDDIALVQSLVTAYIKKPSCIILLTVACESERYICCYVRPVY